MTTRFDGKVVLITGAARGQGAAEARAWVAGGGSVVVTDLLAEEGRALVEELGDAARFVDHDVRDAESWDRAIAAALDSFGQLNCLVNNAAIYRPRAIDDETRDSYNDVIQVNLVGTFLGVRAALEPMRAAGGGSIVNIASIAGAQGYAWQAAYSSSKWGVRGLTRCAALEYGPHNIRVNAVLPGPIDTPMLPVPRDGTPIDARFAHMPVARAGRPEEVADLVLYLLSDTAAYITGAEFVIDGGAFAGPRPAPRPPFPTPSGGARG